MIEDSKPTSPPSDNRRDGDRQSFREQVMPRRAKSKSCRPRPSEGETALLDTRTANLKKKHLTCLRCGRMLRTDRCHRICRSCRRRIRDEVPGRPVLATVTVPEELVEVSDETLAVLAGWAELPEGDLPPPDASEDEPGE